MDPSVFGAESQRKFEFYAVGLTFTLLAALRVGRGAWDVRPVCPVRVGIDACR